MLAFATEFPVQHDRHAADFFRAIEGWILGSPHTRLRHSDFAEMIAPCETHVVKGTESLEREWVSCDAVDTAGARYTRRDDDLEWVTTIVFSRAPEQSWVGIRVTCESTHPAVQLPQAKKPIIVRSLLTELGGAQDGVLQVDSNPRILLNSEIDLAARLIDGSSGCRLPIVYVSCHFTGGHIVSFNRLATALAGMAHVVVEPNRAFSVRIKDEVAGENVYGGTVGVYWPEGVGRKSFFVGRDLISPAEVEEAVIAEVQNALANRRQLDACSWPYLQEIASRQAMGALKASGSLEIERYVETFDKDISARDERLLQANREIQRLQAELRACQARSPLGSTSLLKSGREQDFYPREVFGIIHRSLKDALTRVPENCRRNHVIKDILQANPLEVDQSELIKDRLREALRASRGLDAGVRRALEELGFTVSSDGKHHKIVFQGDDRYVFSLPKTGSDHRGGLNAASEIGRMLF